MPTKRTHHESDGTHEEFFNIPRDQLLATLKRIIREGNVRRIIIKDRSGNSFLEIPVTVGVVGVVLAPVAMVLGTLATLVGGFTIEVIRRDSDAKPPRGRSAKK